MRINYQVPGLQKKYRPLPLKNLQMCYTERTGRMILIRKHLFSSQMLHLKKIFLPFLRLSFLICFFSSLYWKRLLSVGVPQGSALNCLLYSLPGLSHPILQLLLSNIIALIRVHAQTSGAWDSPKIICKINVYVHSFHQVHKSDRDFKAL